MSADDRGDEKPQKTRTVKVRTTTAHPSGLGPEYRTMSLPEDVAGQWDDEQWHSSPPGV